jgi:hypothetical protein
MNVDRHVKYLLHILRKFEFSLYILEKYSNAKFHENLFSGADLFHADEGTTDGQA